MNKHDDQTEAVLNSLRQGGDDALAELFTACRSRLKQLVQLHADPRMAGRVDPSDVLQETYLDARKQMDRYLANPAASPYIWLRGLTLNRLSNLRRTHVTAKMRSVRRQQALPVDSSIQLARHLVQSETSPSRAMMRDELQVHVQEAIEQLSAEDREVILMRHFENMTNNEVSEALGIKPSAATMRYGRALERLRQKVRSITSHDGTRGDVQP